MSPPASDRLNPKRFEFQRWGLLGLGLLVALLFLGAPTGGDFYWSDAPRHALNGVFVKDLLAAMPLDDPAGFAYQYYAQYPALTILFYPPLFYVISAPFYAVFGVSHGTALLIVGLHYLAFAWGSLRLFGFWVPGWRAVAATVMLVAAPEIAFWGRQVMLEVPAFAFLVWSAVCFMRYRREGKPRLLYWTVALLVLAIYTKISVAFLAVAFAGALLMERKRAVLGDRHVWIASALAGLALIPLLVITAKFGQANVQSVVGVADSVAQRQSLEAWVWYLRQMPDQIGWPVCALALAGLLAALLRRGAFTGPSHAARRGDVSFWLLWGLGGYLFFSAIDLKEARHSVFILPVVVMLSCFFLTRLAAVGWPRLATLLWLAPPLAVLIQTLIFRPVYFVGGYAAAADYIARHAPLNSRVLFSGYRDGSFVFNMRSREDRPDLGVVRADKILLKVAVRRELGVTEKDVSDEALLAEINRLGIRYVVAQPGFWTDLEAMRRFERLLGTDHFQELARIATPANHKAHEKELVIYRNLGEVAEGKSGIQIDLPIINRSIKTPGAP
jgi:hypothetical protein